MPESEMTVKEALDYLGVSHSKMWRLISSGKLPARKDPLDERRKLVKKSDLQKLKEESKQ